MVRKLEEFKNIHKNQDINTSLELILVVFLLLII